MPLNALPVETLPLPTPYAVGPVNSYLIAADPLTMVDAGVNTVDAENALRLGFASRGLALDSVGRILITHAHPDHYGLVPWLQNMSGASAFMGDQDLQRISGDATHWEFRRLLLEAGFPQEELKTLAERERRVHRVHRVAEMKCSPVYDGQSFEFRDFILEAISLPGHTAGHIGYYEPHSGSFFAGDTLLPHFSRNPLLEPILEPEGESPAQRRRSLKQYLESLDRLEALDLRTVYPGHGPVIDNPAETIRYMRTHYASRLEVVSACLSATGKSAYQVSGELYPSRNCYDHFLAVSEVLAHLDVLVGQGRASHEIREDGIEYFCRPG
ncbi:MAG: MBL fold metallo-hydrolase [Actinomycetota bacterium]